MHMSKAFSLVELSIVLVILGLLTGGILAGQSLIRASELRALTSELQRYYAATNTFRDKYFAIPGDLRDATRFWGRLTTNADCVSYSGAAGPNANGACDGNGNGSIVGSGAANASGESYQFWRQLALAGIIEGSYTGIAGAANEYDASHGIQVPASRISNGGWVAWTKGVQAAGGNLFVMDYGNVFNFGRRSSAAVWTRAIGLLRPGELWNIDTKIDDGRPAYGTIIAHQWGNLASADACTMNAVDENDRDADYNLSTNTLNCGFFALKAF